MIHIGLVVSFLLTAGSASVTKLAVMPLQIDVSAKGRITAIADEVLLAAVQQAGDYEVIGNDDISQLVSFEKYKDLLGCDDTTCMVEIAGALGVDELIVTTVAYIADEWVIAAKRINLKKTKVMRRVSRFVPGDMKALLQALPAIASELMKETKLAKVVARPVPPKKLLLPKPKPKAPVAATSPSRLMKKNRAVNSEMANGLQILAGLVLLGSVAFDLAPASSKDGKLGVIDFLPVAGYVLSATLAVVGAAQR